MVLVKMAANPTLKGHKLLIVNPWGTPQSYLDRLRADFPDLEIDNRDLKALHAEVSTAVNDDEWKDVTISLQGRGFPKPEQAPKMELVQMWSAGANHILKHPLFTDTVVSFCTANGIHGPPISEWVISTFLAHQHHIPKYLEYQKEAKWMRPESMLNRDSVGQRVGILGYGSIGRQVARVCKAMGMDVHAYTLHPKDTPKSRRDHGYVPPGTGDPDGVFPGKWFSGGSKEEIHAFLGSDLDLLVVSVPLTDKTTGMIGKEEFQVMSSRKTFVSNIARGPIIKTDDLIKALDNEVIRGAALDVTDPEPLPDGHHLFSAKNLILTPHVSGGTTAYGERVLEILKLNLDNLSQDKKLVNKVSRKDGY